jgi:hypothetical protein
MKNKVIKNLIAPLQKVLLQKKFCPACTRNLTRAKHLGESENGLVVACECGRIFVYDKETDVYHRALNEDLRSLTY